jgi:hypothetical protein
MASANGGGVQVVWLVVPVGVAAAISYLTANWWFLTSVIMGVGVLGVVAVSRQRTAHS